jgi:protein-S-isoprenylcysteine O-methyltransferase Ste14
MTLIFAASRALAYMTGFVFVWGWLALQVRSIDGGLALPAGSRLVGTALMVVGGIVVLCCAGWFLVVGRGTPAPFDAPRAFVAGGPYRWVRNPMYLGALLVLMGFGLWHASFSMVVLAIPAAAVAHLFVVVYEEPTLRHRFGLPYVAYLALVNRWLPKRPSRDAAQAVGYHL